jgi:hypothetical protein
VREGTCPQSSHFRLMVIYITRLYRKILIHLELLYSLSFILMKKKYIYKGSNIGSPCVGRINNPELNCRIAFERNISGFFHDFRQFLTEKNEKLVER